MRSQKYRVVVVGVDYDAPFHVNAKKYHRKGFDPIPIRVKGKKPLIQWGQFKSCRVTLEEIDMYGKRFPNANMALLTGKEFFVLDVDGESGKRSIAGKALPKTVQSTTGRGLHYFFKLPSTIEIHNKTGILPGVDVKGINGLITVPPSVHSSGKRYRWVEGCSPFLTEIADAPKWLLELITASPEANSSPEKNSEEWPIDVEIGERNDTLTRLCGRYVGMGLGQKEVELLLSSINRGLSSPLSEKEVLTICKSIYGKEQRGKALVRPTIPTDWLTTGADLLSSDPEPTKWLIESLWTDESCGFIGAEPKSGKTWLALEMAIAVVSGKPVFGRFDVPNPGPILFIAEEGKSTDLKRRLFQLANSKKLTAENLKSLDLSIQKAVQIDTIEWQEQIRRYCSRRNPRAIFIDPFVRVHSANEDRSDAMQPVLRFLRSLRNDFNTSVILIHHHRKPREDQRGGVGQRLRGSGDLYAWLDCGVYLDKLKGEMTTAVKIEHRDAPDTEPFILSMKINDHHAEFVLKEGTPDDIKIDEIGKKILEYVKSRPREEGVLNQELLSAIKCRGDMKGKALNRLMIQGQLKRVTEGRADKKGKMRDQTVWKISKPISFRIGGKVVGKG